MEKIKFLAILCLGILAACTEKESINNPAEEPESSSSVEQSSSSVEQNSSSVEQPSSSSMGGNSSAAVSQEPTWGTRYSISINESRQEIKLNFEFRFDACQLVGEDSVSFRENRISVVQPFQYSIDGNKMVLTSQEKGNTSSDTLLTSSESESVFNIWISTTSKDAIKITQDSLFSTQKSIYSEKTDPVESTIDLTSSVFMEDLYNCGTGSSCSFSHWHFTKKAPSFILDEISKMDIHEKTDRTASLTFAGKDFTIAVEHVQVDSLNNGNTLVTAYIQSSGDTCRFEHVKQAVNKELCVPANRDGLLNYTYKDEEGNTLSSTYSKDNASSFAACVARFFSES